MTRTQSNDGATGTKTPKRYRLPNIEKEGIAQLSLLETALWPLRGGMIPGNAFQTSYSFPTSAGRTDAKVTVRAAMGLEQFDELVLWGLLGCTLSYKDADPILLATPYWILRHLGLKTGGSQYAELRDSLVRLAVTSYQNTGFFNPETKEHEYAAFQFLSILLPTVGGRGERVDNDRTWRIEWNQAFFRFARATGGNLLFDLDLFRKLKPASRRLYLKLQSRFWRSKRVFYNIDDLTVNGLGFSASRPLKKRKYDLLGCMRELLAHRIIELGKGQTDPKDLFLKRGKGSYVVCFYEGEYFREAPAARAHGQKNAIADDPLREPLRAIGVDGPGIRRLLEHFPRATVQRWVRITEAAIHEKPRGFPGFKASPAAFLIDGIQNKRTPPDWFHAHEKRQEKRQWEQKQSSIASHEPALRTRYDDERGKAFRSFFASPEGRSAYEKAIGPLLRTLQGHPSPSLRGGGRRGDTPAN